MATCVVDTRQGDGAARIVRATVFERLGDEGMSPSIEYWHGEAADHRALADKILDSGGGDTMKLTGKRVRSISLKNHGISFAYCRSSISAITGACLLKAGNIPSSGLRQQINS